MQEPSRLFDLPDYQLARFPQPDMLAGKVDGAWRAYSTAEVIALVRSLAAGLLRLGIQGHDLTPEGQDKVAILSGNRPEWVIVDQAVQQTGAVLVPIYPTINPLELEYVLNESGSKIVFVSNKELFDKVHALKERLPALIGLFTFEDVAGADHWSSLCGPAGEEELRQLDALKASIGPHHLVTILYTSGTTGYPKGVMLSHDNILSNVKACLPILPLDESSRVVSSLPLNHVYERMITYLYIAAGVSIYQAESLETIGEDLREVRPHFFTTVPRLLEKVYERIMAKGAELKGIKRRLFYWAIELGARFEINKPQPLSYRLQLAVADRLVFVKWREALGGSVKTIVTGSAPCQVRLLRLFTAAGIDILEGYGLTETSPVIAVNRVDRKERRFGTVGPIIGGIEVRIADDGEILCKGPNIMLGYYKHPEMTAEAIVDGWFHTGDIGTLAEGRFLKITDRKKELFKTSGGKYVAPQPIENKMKESPFIEQIMVTGAGRKFTSALVVPRFGRLKEWAKEHGLPDLSHEALIARPEVVALIKKEVERLNEQFNHVEQIKKIELIPTEWTIAGGELTPTLKLKRKVIEERYHDVIDRIYH